MIDPWPGVDDAIDAGRCADAWAVPPVERGAIGLATEGRESEGREFVEDALRSKPGGSPEMDVKRRIVAIAMWEMFWRNKTSRRAVGTCIQWMKCPRPDPGEPGSPERQRYKRRERAGNRATDDVGKEINRCLSRK